MSDKRKYGWPIALLALGTTACAHAPAPEPTILRIMVPHICLPNGDSAAFQKCKADCPDGEAMLWENKTDTACFCKKPPDGT